MSTRAQEIAADYLVLHGRSTSVLLEQRADDESTATSARRLVGRGRPALPRVGAESVLVYRISAVPVSCPLRLSRTGSGVTLTP